MSMLIQQSATEMIRRLNRDLVEHLRDKALMLKFKEPVRRPLIQPLVGIQMPQDMLKSGADQFMLPEFDRRKMAERMNVPCRMCGLKMKRVGADELKCLNSGCENFAKTTKRPTGQGIVSLAYDRRSSVWVDHIETVTEDVMHGDNFLDLRGPVKPAVTEVHWLKQVVARLDRAYNDETLAALYFACVEVGQVVGFEVL